MCSFWMQSVDSHIHVHGKCEICRVTCLLPSVIEIHIHITCTHPQITYGFSSHHFVESLLHWSFNISHTMSTRRWRFGSSSDDGNRMILQFAHSIISMHMYKRISTDTLNGGCCKYPDIHFVWKINMIKMNNTEFEWIVHICQNRAWNWNWDCNRAYM